MLGELSAAFDDPLVAQHARQEFRNLRGDKKELNKFINKFRSLAL